MSSEMCRFLYKQADSLWVLFPVGGIFFKVSAKVKNYLEYVSRRDDNSFH